MDEYVDFIEASIRTVNPVYAARQKQLEERIETPFSFPPPRLHPPILQNPVNPV
jgi:hypothetical protein